MTPQTKQEINHFAGIYTRYKDQYDQILPATIEEIHSKIRREFMALPYKVEYRDDELNDFAVVKSAAIETNTLIISTLHNNSKLLPGELNLAFRAWHDAVHIQYDLPFDYDGERKAWFIQTQGMSRQATQVLFSEIVLQTSFFLHYGYFPDDQKIVLVDSYYIN